MKKILVVAMAVALPNEKGPERFYYISRLLMKNGYDVELITGTYQHWEKRQRDEQTISGDVKVKLIKQSGYPKTVCIKRIVSLWNFANRVEKYIKNSQYDLIYCSIPDNRTAALVAKIAKKHNRRVIIDIEDLWPEGMIMALEKYKMGRLFNKFLFLYRYYAKKAYRYADGYIGTSDEYTFFPNQYDKRNVSKKHSTVYVGTDLDIFDNCSIAEREIDKPKNEKWVMYAGTIGVTYDIETLVECAKKTKEIDDSFKFYILGDGPLRQKLEQYAAQLDANVKFMGYMKYDKMVQYLCKADLLINSFAKGAPQSIVTKVGDYLAAGKPIINTLESPEFCELINEKNIGYNVEPENAVALCESIIKSYKDMNELKKMGRNARELAEERFDRKNAYLKILEMVNELT